jgi:ATP-dependent DNA helicase RecQ
MYDERDLATQMEFIGWSNPDAEYYERVHYFLKHEHEQIAAFGMEWLREKLHAKNKHDRRLETTLGMLDRWGVIEGTLNPLNVSVIAELPDHLNDTQVLNAKRERDQRKLLAMLQYVKHEGDRKAFFARYFGIE